MNDDDDVDRAAILSRREALITMALGGLSLACGDAEPVVCLQPQVVNPPCLQPCSGPSWHSLGRIELDEGVTELDERAQAEVRAALAREPDNAIRRLSVLARALPVEGEPDAEARQAARVDVVAQAMDALGAASHAPSVGSVPLPEPAVAAVPTVEILGYFEIRYC